ncbi:nucleotide exchange factor GrpE [Streptomyces sp. ST2-7A]|uniref:nucleotide exchange factor GrpE n=1 Tax=Streptomyces sp. ST2-7A TaxID=2907214 RepID=UPI001F001E8B|nr:nucleotide exchange factor GrpE [Streptomyces sp. ST2-7A]MCE7082837.1 nucleotide exchange factor GrpE [Streptomyces sp. ST2-7A]
MTSDPKGFDNDREPEVPDAGTDPESPSDGARAAEGGADTPPSEGGGAPTGETPDSADTDGRDAEAAAAVAREAGLTAQLDQVRTALNERTLDLQRLQAEFQNYRRRVDRDRVAVKEIAIANLLTELLPVLDDIGRARDHGELVGGFKQVAESLETVAAKLGLMQFGKEGEPFDPTIHEALMHSYSPDVKETTCVQILQPGYRINDRTIRPARVGVAEPQPGSPAGEASAGDSPAGESGDGGDGEKESGGPEEG